MIDAAAIARDTAALVQVPSITGDERAVLERLGELAAALGLDAELHEHDLAALRAHPDHPGEEAARDELLGLTVTLARHAARPRRGVRPRRRRDAEGSEPWRHGPWSGRIEDGHVHGRGALDMKGGGGRRAARAGGAARRASAPRSCCWRSPPRRTAGSARSPRSSATPPSTPA